MMRLAQTGAEPLREWRVAAICLASATITGVSSAEYGFRPVMLAFGGLALVATLVVAASRPHVAAPLLLAIVAAFPVARIVVASAPIYAIDVLVLVALVALGSQGLRAGRYGQLVFVYLLVWLPAYLYQVASLGLVAAPTYGLIRNALAVLAFFVGRQMLLEGRRVATIRALAAATLVTSVLAVLQELGPTYDSIRSFLTALAPSFTPSAYHVYPHRASALLASPPALAGFLAVAAFLLIASYSYVRGRTRVLVACAIASIGPALVATYSRGWILGAVPALLVLGLLNAASMRRVLVAGASVLAIVWILLATGALNVQYLDARFSTFGLGDRNAQLRIERQNHFIAVASQQPEMMLIGHGFSGQDIIHRGLVDTETADTIRNGVSDNGYLLEIFDRGIFALLVLVTLMLRAWGRGFRALAAAGEDRILLCGLLGALTAAIILHLENYFVEQIFMKTFFWLIVGMLVGLSDALVGRRNASVRAGGGA
jgi:O-antigen ligase